jgi:hypothetical protein
MKAEVPRRRMTTKAHVMGYEIVKKPSIAGFTFDIPGGDGAV